MGIKLFSSKKFKISIIITVVASLLYILEFLVKIKILKGLLSLWKWIINLKIPAIIFIIIILALLIWLILINRKPKKSLLTDERKSKIVSETNQESEKTKEEIKPKKEKKKLKLTEEQSYILAMIAGSTELLSASDLLNNYERKFSGAHIVEVKAITIWLKENGLIEHSGTIENEPCYTATDEGIKIY